MGERPRLARRAGIGLAILLVVGLGTWWAVGAWFDRSSAHVLVVMGTYELGFADEGEWAGLSWRTREGESVSVSVSGSMGDDLMDPGAPVAVAEVPTSAQRVGFHRIICPPYGCREREVRRQIAESGPEGGRCSITLDAQDRDIVIVRYDHPSLGSPQCTEVHAPFQNGD